ncbi:MAG: dihydrofolate reductase [Candidatus Staskawiczbacteria bacterium]|nr:dihydrofolate reductase [Candidatus Staskawiczbacteria bacterium]MBI3337063.1 dihydrofolate reductase [Candidatus Staskawiczbacteria bacterium]
MMISIISAVAENRVIGNKNALPWHLPADFKYFKEKTLNKTIILGLNTFKSIGSKPLPNRKHIILNDDLNYVPPDGCFVAHSINESLEMIKNEDEVMVCGGASVYKQFLPLANKLYLTYIHHNFEGDTFFPEFDISDWKEISRIDHEPDDPSINPGQAKNLYSYSFVVLERKK